MAAVQRSDLARQALQAFEKALPQLWAERPGQWVAYQGDHLLGFAAHQHELYHQCFAQGFVPDEFLVFCIEPVAHETFLGVDTGG
jgi:hypothetical protein